MHKRVDPGVSPSDVASESEVAPEKGADAPIARALDKPKDRIVKQVSYGLMRIEAHRRFRVFFRRLAYLLLIAGIVTGLWYFFGDRIPMDDVKAWWDETQARLFPDYSDLAPRKPSVHLTDS